MHLLWNVRIMCDTAHVWWGQHAAARVSVGVGVGAKHRQWSPLYRCICDRKAVRSPFTKVKVLTTQLPDRAKSYIPTPTCCGSTATIKTSSLHAAQSQHPRVAIPPREDGAIIDAYARACIGGGDLQASHVVCLSCSTVTGVCSASSSISIRHTAIRLTPRVADSILVQSRAVRCRRRGAHDACKESPIVVIAHAELPPLVGAWTPRGGVIFRVHQSSRRRASSGSQRSLLEPESLRANERSPRALAVLATTVHVDRREMWTFP